MRHRNPSDHGPIDTSGPAVPAPDELPPRRWITALFCLLTLSWVFAFTPDPIVWVTIPALVGWLAVIDRSRTFGEALLWLFLFGAVATLVGYRWLAPTIQDFGGVPASVSWLLTALFGVWNVLHGILFMILYRSMTARGYRPHPLVLAALFAACESLPIRMFAWSAGHGAVDVPPLLQAAEWGGVPAVSFVLLCLVFPIYEWLRWAFVRGGAAPRPRAALVTFVIGVALFGVGLARYAQVNEEDAAAERHLRVGIVQANVGSGLKREATNGGQLARVDSIAAYRRGTERAAADGATLIVWPETAITDAVPLQDDLQTNHYLRRIQQGYLNEIGSDRALLLGLYERVMGRRSVASGKRLENRYNVAALRQPGGEHAPWTKYRKVHLIPFGETMPLSIFEDRLPQNFKMVPGTLPQPLLETAGVTLAPFLCYEAILADHVREYVAGRRPDILVSMTNDSWFGDSWEPGQHLSFTRFRAVEHRAPIVRATNTGISAFISSTGDVVSSLAVGLDTPYADRILVRDVPLTAREPSLYVRLGYRLPWLLWAIALGGWLLLMLRPPPILEHD